MISTESNVGKTTILLALKEVMDPELPFLSVVDLGIIGDIDIHENRVLLKILPTFTACPAIQLMREQIIEKILSLGFYGAEVEVDYSIPWNSDRISEEGKKKLEKFGLATADTHQGNFSIDDIEQSKCPHCSSCNTTMNSIFGSTLCRSMHYCFDCRQGFERFKPL
ncbi:MAG: phenylacetate-CoA oxygenase subunit PaaJ [Chitinophagales bacterium]|nr:phenylacetate-CoA oxygenase subunit PaaJ [Chitinophagales bacterium]